LYVSSTSNAISFATFNDGDSDSPFFQYLPKGLYIALLYSILQLILAVLFFYSIFNIMGISFFGLSIPLMIKFCKYIFHFLLLIY